MEFDGPSAAHFIYIPVCVLVGIVIGWVLGGRAAADAYLAEMKKRERKEGKTRS